MLVTVFAAQSFVHDGHAYARGDALQTTVIDALRLCGQRKVSLSLRPGRRLRASAPDVSLRQADVTPEPSVVHAPAVDAFVDEATPSGDVDPAIASDTDTHELESDDEIQPTRRRGRGRPRRSYRRTEVDVGETTDLDAEQ